VADPQDCPDTARGSVRDESEIDQRPGEFATVAVDQPPFGMGAAIRADVPVAPVAGEFGEERSVPVGERPVERTLEGAFVDQRRIAKDEQIAVAVEVGPASPSDTRRRRRPGTAGSDATPVEWKVQDVSDAATRAFMDIARVTAASLVVTRPRPWIRIGQSKS
jgi:hypothetical protein